MAAILDGGQGHRTRIRKMTTQRLSQKSLISFGQVVLKKILKHNKFTDDERKVIATFFHGLWPGELNKMHRHNEHKY